MVNSGPPATTLTPAARQRSSSFARRLTLHGHAADEHVVGPRQILIGERAHVEIDQALVPLGGQHGRNGQQAQRRRDGFLAHELERVLETPERVGELGIDQQDIHGTGSVSVIVDEGGRRSSR